MVMFGSFRWGSASPFVPGSAGWIGSSRWRSVAWRSHPRWTPGDRSPRWRGPHGRVAS